MKCPECGKELEGKKICPQCGKKAEAAVEDIEVAYKEFPKSEYLEILAKPAKTGADTADIAGKEENGVEAPDTTKRKSLKKPAGIFGGRWVKEVFDKRALAFFMAGLLAAIGIMGLYLIVKAFF